MLTHQVTAGNVVYAPAPHTTYRRVHRRHYYDDDRDAAVAGAVAGSHRTSREMVSITINLNVNYMAPHTSEIAVAEGELIRTTRSMFFAQSKLIDPVNNMLCATATGTFKRQERATDETKG